jgi:ornithine cyclodeaminase
MRKLRVLTESELKRVIRLDLESIACIEDAFRALATRNVIMPPILRLDIRESRGEVDVKAAYQPGLPSLAVKVASGFFDNPKIGIPSSNGLMILLSTKTGSIEALLLDNGYLTDLRTAAAGAVAAKHLARKNATVATVFGAGVQARIQLEALCLVRPIRECRLWAREPDKASRLAAQLTSQLGIQARPVSNAESAVAGSDVIVTTTPAEAPILSEAWLEPGQHVTAMGADAEHKNEIDPLAIARADVYVADDLAQTRILGELHHAIKSGLVPPTKNFAELGDVISGTKPGRVSDSDITIADLTGTGIQDTAIANLAFAKGEKSALVIES